MTTVRILWTGLACCIVSLAAQLFPLAAGSIGVDPGAVWRLFGFGLFLVAIAALMTALIGRSGR
ncbi:MAG: hypothetical protein KDD85_07330 [Parvularculaceae bacterium]|nr:hypothetical protein [Parvularculaceae bacterium]